MRSIVFLIAIILTLSDAASLIPLKQTSVNVKSVKSGQDYSYTINENHGVAIETLPIQHEIIIPQIKAIKINNDGVNDDNNNRDEEQLIDEKNLKDIKLEYLTPLYTTYPLHYVPLPYYQLNVNPIPFIP